MGSDNATQHAATQALIADVPTPALPAWAPDGSAIAFLWDDGAGWEVWVVGAAGQSVRKLATGALLSSIEWSRDGSEIVFVRRVDGGSAIAAVNLADETRQVTSGPRDRSPRVSPDGGTVAFLSGRAGAFDIWKAPLAGGAATQLTERTNPLDEPRWSPRWSPDGRWIAYVSSRSGERNNDDLWIVSADGRENRQLTTGLIVDTDPIWSPDGRRLAVVANTEVEHWYGDDLDLWLIDTEDVRPHRLTSGGGVTRKLDGGAVAWSPDGRVVYCLHHVNGDTNLAAVRVEDGLLTRVTNHDGVVSDFTLSPAGDAFAVVIAGQSAPPELAVIAIDGGLPVPLTATSSRVSVPLTAPIRMPFQSYDGIFCDAYLYLPAGFSAGRQFPALVQVHGGGTNSFGNGWHPIEQFLAQRGFIVFAVEYRGSSGYGRDFAGLSYADWGGGQTRDAIAAADFLRTKAYVSGVGIYGSSYGGYLALHAVVSAPEAFGAAADLYGITNRFDYFDRSDRVGRVFVTRDYGGRGPADAPDLYLRASTHHRLSEIRTPLLVLHGSDDTRVPPVQSEALVEQLRRHNIEHEYVVYPGEGHGFRKREHRIDAYERLAGWFDRHLGDGPHPPTRHPEGTRPNPGRGGANVEPHGSVPTPPLPGLGEGAGG